MDKSRKKYLTDRFVKLGADGLLPKDALELLLACSGCAEPEEAAEALFGKYLSLEEILNADAASLLEVSGMSAGSAELIGALPRLYSFITASELVGSRLDDPENACRYFKKQFLYANVEHFRIACLDGDYFPLCCEMIGSGSGAGVTVDAAEILKTAAERRSDSVIIAHNHPAGSCLPSEADIGSTKALAAILEREGIKLLDHVIVGRDGVRTVGGYMLTD